MISVIKFENWINGPNLREFGPAVGLAACWGNEVGRDSAGLRAREGRPGPKEKRPAGSARWRGAATAWRRRGGREQSGGGGEIHRRRGGRDFGQDAHFEQLRAEAVLPGNTRRTKDHCSGSSTVRGGARQRSFTFRWRWAARRRRRLSNGVEVLRRRRGRE